MHHSTDSLEESEQHAKSTEKVNEERIIEDTTKDENKTDHNKESPEEPASKDDEHIIHVDIETGRNPRVKKVDVKQSTALHNNHSVEVKEAEHEISSSSENDKTNEEIVTNQEKVRNYK